MPRWDSQNPFYSLPPWLQYQLVRRLAGRRLHVPKRLSFERAMRDATIRQSFRDRGDTPGPVMIDQLAYHFKIDARHVRRIIAEGGPTRSEVEIEFTTWMNRSHTAFTENNKPPDFGDITTRPRIHRKIGTRKKKKKRGRR